MRNRKAKKVVRKGTSDEQSCQLQPHCGGNGEGDEERGVLTAVCNGFGKAWRASYGRKLTPKDHIMEVRVSEFVLCYHACGMFGEDGAEVLHVIDSASRLIVRCMRNPADRKRAQDLHHLARVVGPDVFWKIRRWQSKKNRRRGQLPRWRCVLLPWSCHLPLLGVAAVTAGRRQ